MSESLTVARVIEIATALHSSRYADARAVFAAGSFVRGEGTPHSDLDLVVVYERLPNAFRDSFRFQGVPIETFVHDPETLEYFFVEVDRRDGAPLLPQMISEGIEIPTSNALSQALKQRARELIASGPPSLDDETEQRMRYFVSDLVDDLRAPRSRHELIASGARLYEQLADYWLRRGGRWSAKGKAIPCALRQVDSAMGDLYCAAFEQLFTHGDAAEVIALAERLLHESGGLLFEGYRSDAPPTWRLPGKLS